MLLFLCLSNLTTTTTRAVCILASILHVREDLRVSNLGCNSSEHGTRELCEHEAVRGTLMKGCKRCCLRLDWGQKRGRGLFSSAWASVSSPGQQVTPVPASSSVSGLFVASGAGPGAVPHPPPLAQEIRSRHHERTRVREHRGPAHSHMRV